MTKPKPLSRPADEKDALLSNVALLYYGEGLTQSEIAQRIKVSRATVVNMLRESKELGIVEIRVDGRYLTGSSTSRALRDKFGLVDVYVSRTDVDGGAPSRTESLRQLGRVSAAALLDVVEHGDRIGVAWGETMMAVADAMPRHPVPGTEVCQLIGSMLSGRVPASENCAIQIANKLDAACYTLHAPGLISSSELAGIIRREPTIAAQIERLGSLDLAIFSIGNMQADTHLRVAGMATTEELQEARSAGGVGIVCCRYIDAHGQELPLPPQDRLIAATMNDLKTASKRLLVVCGADRGEAALAAIRGGLCTHLCVDEALGRYLVNA